MDQSNLLVIWGHGFVGQQRELNNMLLLHGLLWKALLLHIIRSLLDLTCEEIQVEFSSYGILTND